jgi:hypothetical protein
LDLRHWFHQLKTGSYLQSQFIVAFGSLRLQWNVLPMGFTWAPFVAQAVTTMLVVGPEMASTWTELAHVIEVGKVRVFVVYDNIIAGGPEADVDAFWAELLCRLEHYQVMVKPGSDVRAINGGHLDAIGLRWIPSLHGLIWSLLPKFLDKIREAVKMVERSTCRVKEISSAIGLLSWGRYATKSDLCDLQPAYAELTADVASYGWRGYTTPGKYNFVFEKLSALQGSGWQRIQPAADEVLAYSDAHNICGHGHVGGAPVVC